MSVKVVYFGFNNMFKHKRGVENVIDFQSKSRTDVFHYYIHWDNKTSVYHYENFLCIGIQTTFFRFFVLNWFLFKIRKRNRSIFIHSHNSLMTLMSLFQTNLFTVHDALYYQNKAINHRFKNIFYLLEIYLYKRTKFVHFISDFAKKMSLFDRKENFVIIPNTSHLENYKRHLRTVPDNTLAKFNSLSTKVFSVRSIEERARIDLVLKVAIVLKEANFEFFIAGKGPLLDFYSKLIKQLGLVNIKLLGYVSDQELVNYYLDCDIVLLTAEYGEGFGLPIIEGYLFDKPVIASNKCAIPDVIMAESFLFENTVESIKEKLEYAKGKLNGTYNDYYNSRFSNSHVLNRFSELYKSLM